MAGYEREFTKPINYRTRLRVGFSTVRGTPTEFVVQLEYLLDDEWWTVARFDHNPDLGMGHDVTEEGLHLDIYRDGKKYDVEHDFPAVDINDAPTYCKSYLERNADEYVGRFERWHETDPNRKDPNP